MKIQCDVCNKEEAAVFCSADEAALCSDCDHRVHHANKLAGKHHRFSLIQPLPKQFPLCDICQIFVIGATPGMHYGEKRAFLFCQQDRAIMCKDCDIPIHKANEHTQKHNRFLLTGVKLSTISSLYSPSSASITSYANSLSDIVPNLKPINKPVSAQLDTNSNPSYLSTNSEKVLSQNERNQLTSVSQYLMETPGWQVEDLLDSSSSASFGLNKTDDLTTIWDANLGSISSDNIEIWVPQVPTPSYQFPYPSSNISFGGQVGYKAKEISTNKSSKKWISDDNCFTVPEINNSPSSLSKRSRTYW